MPAMRREERPAPPEGAGKLLTVPEAVQFAREQAQQRGDRRALLMQQDIRKDIHAGRFELGRDAFWVSVPAHPKGGYWVLTLEAVQRRIRERLRGRGRPRIHPRPEEAAEKSSEAAPTPAVAAAPAKGPVRDTLPASVTVEPLAAETPEPGKQRSSSSVEPPVQQSVPPVVAAVGNRGPVPWPVHDPQQYREAVRRALQGDTKQYWHKTVFVCRQCGWVGLEGEFHRIQRAGGGWQDSCPECGAIRLALEGEIGYVRLLVRELHYLERDVASEAERTRNEKWAARLRTLLRHLSIYASQAELEEEITPGVKERVAALRHRIEGMLAEQVILPAAMRTEPKQSDLDKLARPLVQQVMERLTLFRVNGPVVEEILAAVRSEGAVAFARAVLDGVVPWEAVWSTLRWLAKEGVGGRELESSGRLLELLDQVPARDLEEARLVYYEVRRRGQAFDIAGEKWAKEDAINRYRWEAHRQTAGLLHRLFTAMDSLLMQEARARVQAQVDAEAERLANLARTEAASTGRDPLQIVAGWVRSKSKKHFASPDLIPLVAYSLAQKLAGGKVLGAPQGR